MSDSSLLLPKISIIEPEQKLEHSQALTHICIHTYRHSLIQKCSLLNIRGENETPFMFQGVGAFVHCRQWDSVYLPSFSLAVNQGLWTELEQRRRWRLRRHCTPYSRPPKPTSIRLTSPPATLVICFGHFNSEMTALLLLWRGSTSLWVTWPPPYCC